MANERFLNHFGPDLLIGNIDEMLASGKLQDKTVLIEYLNQALNYLKTFPGPHLSRRQELADDWIGWWVGYLKKNTTDPGKIIPFEKIKETLSPGISYGALFAGGFEGTGGHRFALNWMLGHVNPILLLERDSYIEAKSRGGPFLDLRARVSMWAYYNPRITVSVLPEKPAEVDAEYFYKKLFDQTGAEYCFASMSDPLYREKIVRGKFAPFNIIPGVRIQHTTDKVEKLWPDDDHDDWLNITDHVTKLFPDIDIDYLAGLREIAEKEFTEI